MIKCSVKSCSDNNQRKKQGCGKNHNPSACKGYLTTVIEVMEAEILKKTEKIEKLEELVNAVQLNKSNYYGTYWSINWNGSWLECRDKVISEV